MRVRPPGQAGAVSVGEGIGADQEAETLGSGDSAEIPKPKRVCTSTVRNNESGHNNFLWRVCDWSDSGRNSLAVQRALGRCVRNGASAECSTLLERISDCLFPLWGIQGTYKLYRGGSALDSLSGAQRRIRSHSRCRPARRA